jgi:purine-binding chemotaxis protein CheW
MTDTPITTITTITNSTNSTESNQFLTFKLGDEVFALDISRVREVLEHPRITKVPGTPEFMRGVINLRGRVVPVIDIKLKFDMGKTEKTIDTCIIIVEIKIDDEITVLGAMADSVREVIDLESSEIEPAPRIGTRLDTSFIKGMGKKNDLLIMILDIDRVFSIDQLSLFKDARPVREGNTP